MIGIVIVTHQHLADALLETARMLYGKPEKAIGVPLLEGEGLEDLKEKVSKAIDAVNDGDGVLVLVDIFGGTTMNVSALIAAEREDVEIVSGVNIPMLLTVLIEREDKKSLKELARIALSAGKEGIIDVKERIVKKLREAKKDV
ncbi:MAG: PTS sugar transporter subunit IIA [Candidatus Njordarchaeales archaeon]